MDIANKTEKISAPDTKHDDYCDSSVMAIHAALSMLPSEGTFASVSIENKKSYNTRATSISRGGMGMVRSRKRKNTFNKRALRGI
jgi:hypothetical protein